MKKFFVLSSVLVAILVMSGCSSTWEGVKEDTTNAWNKTRQGIHNATE
ncbi:MAG: entericidin EcnAB [Sulfurimonas sp.]|jgi:PBP1b-binding outer membrane lipoprotein LpoB